MSARSLKSQLALYPALTEWHAFCPSSDSQGTGHPKSWSFLARTLTLNFQNAPFLRFQSTLSNPLPPNPSQTAEGPSPTLPPISLPPDTFMRELYICSVFSCR